MRTKRFLNVVMYFQRGAISKMEFIFPADVQVTTADIRAAKKARRDFKNHAPTTYARANSCYDLLGSFKIISVKGEGK